MFRHTTDCPCQIRNVHREQSNLYGDCSRFLQDKLFRTGCLRNCATSRKDRSATYRRYGILHPKGNSGQYQICELDHLVPLEMGGADTVENIWPQCGPSDGTLRTRYFKRKDVVENYLTAQVKNGSMDLAEAQKEIARDWTQFLEIANASVPPTPVPGTRPIADLRPTSAAGHRRRRPARRRRFGRCPHSRRTRHSNRPLPHRRRNTTAFQRSVSECSPARHLALLRLVSWSGHVQLCLRAPLPSPR